MDQKFDFIFASDILYEVKNYSDLIKILDLHLAKNGTAFFYSKMYYYGNGGSVYEFESCLEKQNFAFKEINILNNKNSNKIALIRIKK